MSRDVEIIEDCKQIIEISDDDSLIVDSPDLILISNVEEIPEERNNESNAEVVGVQEETPELPPTVDNNNSCLRETIPVQRSTNQPTPIINKSINQYISSENNITKPVDSKVSSNEKSQSNIGVCKRRKRNRGKKKRKAARKKLIENSLKSKILINFKKSDVVQTVSNSSNNKTIQNDTTNMDIPERATCSSNITTPTNVTKNCADYYDFSKLKWLKPLKNLSSPPDLQIVIIDRNHPDWIITNDKWLMIEKRLLEALNNEMLRTNDASIGLFDGAKWQRGIKIVGCQNENAFNYITQFIINLDKLWNGAKLDAFPMSYITRHEVRVYIPPPVLKTELIMSLIKLQNPSICTKDWKVIRERERPINGGVDIWISINDDSFIQLCRLRGEIKYGINRIWINPC